MLPINASIAGEGSIIVLTEREMVDSGQLGAVKIARLTGQSEQLQRENRPIHRRAGLVDPLIVVAVALRKVSVYPDARKGVLEHLYRLVNILALSGDDRQVYNPVR